MLYDRLGSQGSQASPFEEWQPKGHFKEIPLEILQEIKKIRDSNSGIQHKFTKIQQNSSKMLQNSSKMHQKSSKLH